MIDHSLFVTTDRFEVTTPGPNFINPRCFGEDFGKWLTSRLSEQDVDASEPIQEDWGWVIIATFKDRKFTISIGVMDESIGQVPAVWRIGVDYEKSLNGFRVWFKPAPVELLESLFHHVRNILTSESSFTVSNEEPA